MRIVDDIYDFVKNGCFPWIQDLSAIHLKFLPAFQQKVIKRNTYLNTYLNAYFFFCYNKYMTRRKLKNRNIRKLGKGKTSYHITIPVEAI